MKEPLLETRIDRSDIIAWWGGSIEETAKILIDREFPSPTTFRVSRYRFRNAVAVDAAFNSIFPDLYGSKTENACRQAKYDAAAKAFYDYLLQHPVFYKIVQEIIPEPLSMFEEGQADNSYMHDIVEAARDAGLEMGIIDDTIGIALKRKGVVLGVDREFFLKRKYDNFDIESPNIIFPSLDNASSAGLHARYIGAISIHNPEERMQLNRLIDRV